MTTEAVDFSQWTAVNWDATATSPTADWQIEPDGLSLLQTINGAPSAFCSDTDISGLTRAEGVLSVEEIFDNDFVGFVFGYNPGENMDPNADFLLLDWKKGDQGFGLDCGVANALEGLAISRVTGIPSETEFWEHSSIMCPCENTVCPGGLEELQRGTTLGSIGWNDFEEYSFTFEFNSGGRFRAFVNDVLEIDIPLNKSLDGSFCFYNASQDSVRYARFSVEQTIPPTVSQSSIPTTMPMVKIVSVLPTAAPAVSSSVPTAMPLGVTIPVLPTTAPMVSSSVSSSSSRSKRGKGNRKSASMSYKSKSSATEGKGTKTKKKAQFTQAPSILTTLLPTPATADPTMAPRKLPSASPSTFSASKNSKRGKGSRASRSSAGKGRSKASDSTRKDFPRSSATLAHANIFLRQSSFRGA